MENLNIEKFNPTKQEVIKITDKYKNIQIKGLEDEQGYLIAKDSKKELSALRISIKKYGKGQRAEALKYQRAVIKAENKLLEIIQPIEDNIKEQIERIDEQKEFQRMQKYLPDRKARLKEIGIVFEDIVLAQMDNTEFENFFNEKKSEMLAEKERKMQEEKDKLEADKKKLEDEKKLEEARKEAREQAEKQAMLEAEAEKQKAIKETEQKILDEQKEKEEKKKAGERIKQLEQEELQRQEKYQNFLKRNNYKDDGTFTIEIRDYVYILYKKIDEINLNN